MSVKRNKLPATQQRDLEARCLKVLDEHLPFGAPLISGATRFVEDLEMDSLDLLEFKLALEKELGQRASNRKVAHVATVEDLLEFVRGSFRTPS